MPKSYQDLLREARSEIPELTPPEADALREANKATLVDVREASDRFEVTLDLPGLEPEDVHVTFEDGMLTVTGKRHFESEGSGDTWHRIERSFGTFARSIRLPQTADTEKIEATFDKGVLTVSVPKTEQAKPRTIEVQAK